ncbi:MAG: hypothetical protein K9N21_20650, partial [Deltaproteobacteria bacterium]|nr:hypothetical protein [Deltaproteobacteria bacterium]
GKQCPYLEMLSPKRMTTLCGLETPSTTAQEIGNIVGLGKFSPTGAQMNGNIVEAWKPLPQEDKRRVKLSGAESLSHKRIAGRSVLPWVLHLPDL